MPVPPKSGAGRDEVNAKIRQYFLMIKKVGKTMVAKQYSTSGSFDRTLLHTTAGVAGGGVGGGLLGALGGAVAGMVSMLGPALALGAVFGTGALIMGGVGLMELGSVTALSALVPAAIPLAIGGVMGAGSGAVIGGGVGAGLFGARGAIKGADLKARDQQQYLDAKDNLMDMRSQAIANARAEAAEQYTEAGYHQGFEEGMQVGAQSVVSHLMEMQQAQQAQAQGSFADRVGGSKQKEHDSHAAAVLASKEAAANQEHGKA